MFSKISNEFKVGVLTVIAVTLLIIGYNFMMGRDNLLSRGRQYHVMYSNTQGLSVGTALMYNGYRIGVLRKLQMVENGEMIEATIEVSSDLPIPANSKIKLQSDLLGGVTLLLLKGDAKNLAEDGDQLQAEYSKDIFNVINSRVVNLSNSADSLFSTLNQFFHSKDLTAAIGELPGTINELQMAIKTLRETVSAMSPNINNTMSNLSAFSNNFSVYDKELKEGLGHLNTAGKQLDSVQIRALVMNLSNASSQISSIMEKVNKGEGSLGKLVNDDKFYIDLQRTNIDLQKLLLDLKKYPEKYIPVPGTKKQRKKAKKASAADATVW